MKRRLKSLIMFCAVMVIFVFSNSVFGASYTVSAAGTVTVGKTITLKITVSDLTGEFRITSSDSEVVSVSSYSVWLENNSSTITLTAKKAGTVTITVTAYDVALSSTAAKYTEPEPAKVTVKAVAPATPATTTLSSEARLSSLKLNIEGLSPNFNKDKYNYSINVGEDVSKLSMTITKMSSKATYTISGNKDFKSGENIVKIFVTAEDKKTKKTYSINVTKSSNPEASNAYLENLIITNANLKEDFDVNIMKYTLEDLSYDVEKLDIKAFSENQNAKVEIIGNDKLLVGENTVNVIVTSEDAKVVKTYTISFNKLEDPNKSLEEDKYNEVNPYAEKKDEDINSIGRFWKEYGYKIKANITIILLYMLVVVEFMQVVYLYKKLKEANPNYDKIVFKRKNNKEENKVNINIDIDENDTSGQE